MTHTPYSQGFINGRAYEQKRIIELLEKHLGEMDWEDLLKLIQGESSNENR
jgi:hypothetical protein